MEDNEHGISNSTKKAALEKEKRLKHVALWDCTKGNRVQVDTNDVFPRMNEFRRLIDNGEMSLSDIETWIFGKWDMPLKSGDVLEFMDEDPESGG